VDPVLAELARKYVWWIEREPSTTLLVCQLMQLGTYEDVRSARHRLGDAVFRQALKDAPPGILDARSWNFWHLLFGVQPVPPLPTRPLPWMPSSPS
jgi:hypothetical protein